MNSLSGVWGGAMKESIEPLSQAYACQLSYKESLGIKSVDKNAQLSMLLINGYSVRICILRSAFLLQKYSRGFYRKAFLKRGLGRCSIKNLRHQRMIYHLHWRLLILCFYGKNTCDNVQKVNKACILLLNSVI